MTKYRKLPVEIEAFKWTGDVDQTEDPEWCIELIKQDKITFSQINGNPKMHIETLEGVMTADQGDYIIKGIKGEVYPCKPDIFEATYEAV